MVDNKRIQFRDFAVTRAAIDAARKYAEEKGVPLTVERIAACLGVGRPCVKEYAELQPFGALSADEYEYLNKTLQRVLAGEAIPEDIDEQTLSAMLIRKVYGECCADLAEFGLTKAEKQQASVIFQQKNNYDYVDKVEHSGGFNVIFSGVDDVLD